MRELISGGLLALSDYLSAHVVACLVPAFFIAGAIAVFVNQTAVIRYFGAQAKRAAAYGVASASGAILAVCSCTILPLFAGIRQRGAGLGPATTFLYSGPAINVLAIVYSARLLGYDIGVARAIGAILLSVAIGLIMARLFHTSEARMFRERGELAATDDAPRRPLVKSAAFFASLVAFLVAASSIGLVMTAKFSGGSGIVSISGSLLPGLIAFGFLVVVIVLAAVWFSPSENAHWMRETWDLGKKLLPVLLVGVFVAGMFRVLLPTEVVRELVGSNSITANLVASVFGALMYFSTLTEVPAVRMLMDLGMDRGPALTLLLSGPALSLPSMIVIWRVIGFRRTAAYVFLVVVFSTLAGWLFGSAS